MSVVKPADRRQRVADEIKRIVAEAIQRDVNDYNLNMVTILHCEITGDLGEATLHYSVLGGEEVRRDAATHLSKVKGFLQRQVADKLTLYRAPKIHFSYDDALKQSQHLDEIFRKIQSERETDDQKGG